MSNDAKDLKSLGSDRTDYPNAGGVDASVLEAFPNPFEDNDYNIHLETAEFTSLCPKTQQPDFAKITVDYIPKDKCIESKGFKLYMFSFRSEGAFMERITNTILNDLVALVDPKWMRVVGDFAPRGGVGLVVEAIYNENGPSVTTVDGDVS